MTDSKTNSTFSIFVQMPMTSITMLQCPDSLCYISQMPKSTCLPEVKCHCTTDIYSLVSQL